MDIQEIMQTPIWALYEKGRNYHRQTGIYVDTDRNYRMYNGNQWEGAKLGDVEPVQKNFIKPIVKYKCAVIHDNLYAINYSSQNYENREFRKEAERYCDMLNRYASNIWERDKMDFKGRRITKDSAINDEGIIYVDFDQEKKIPINEIVKKNDIYYGNENDDDIQAQPYILIRKRMPVVNARELAEGMGMSAEKVREILKIAQDPVSLETPIGEEEDSHLGDFVEDRDSPEPAESASFTMLKEQINDVLGTLTPREEKVLRLRFGLEDGRTRTLEEVGKEFNVTRERIRQIEAKALRKLRHPSRSKRLKDFLD